MKKEKKIKERHYWFMTLGRGRQSVTGRHEDVLCAIFSLKKRKPNLTVAVWRLNGRRDTLLYAGKVSDCKLEKEYE